MRPDAVMNRRAVEPSNVLSATPAAAAAASGGGGFSPSIDQSTARTRSAGRGSASCRIAAASMLERRRSPSSDVLARTTSPTSGWEVCTTSVDPTRTSATSPARSSDSRCCTSVTRCSTAIGSGSPTATSSSASRSSSARFWNRPARRSDTRSWVDSRSVSDHTPSRSISDPTDRASASTSRTKSGLPRVSVATAFTASGARGPSRNDAARAAVWSASSDPRSTRSNSSSFHIGSTLGCAAPSLLTVARTTMPADAREWTTAADPSSIPSMSSTTSRTGRSRSIARRCRSAATAGICGDWCVADCPRRCCTAPNRTERNGGDPMIHSTVRPPATTLCATAAAKCDLPIPASPTSSTLRPSISVDVIASTSASRPIGVPTSRT